MKYMVVLRMFYPHVFLSGGGSPSITNILSMATELFTWVITQMTSLVTFISNNPLIMIFMLLMLAGFVVGMFRRVAGSLR